jgi:exopolyphosphatase / guanosine-5'-triphosphate,3'-diphosphate pyrophosphatase
MPPQNAAVIDVGSNSVLLLHVAVEPGGVRPLDERLAITRLGAGLVAGGRLDLAARARTRAAVVDFARRARGGGATFVWAFATGAARAASDGAEFARELEGAAGVPVEIVSGDREARLSYVAVGRGLGVSGPLLAIDIGGRTAELSLGKGERVDAAVSLELGALAMTDAHLHGDPPTAAELLAAAATATTTLRTSDLPARARGCGARLAASGGTATALATLDLGLGAYDAKRVHGHLLAYDSLRALATRLAAMPLAERMGLPALDAGRAAILPAGALVLERIAAAAGARGVSVSDHGVRHGYLRERLLEAGLDIAMGTFA